MIGTTRCSAFPLPLVPRVVQEQVVQREGPRVRRGGQAAGANYFVTRCRCRAVLRSGSAFSATSNTLLSAADSNKCPTPPDLLRRVQFLALVKSFRNVGPGRVSGTG